MSTEDVRDTIYLVDAHSLIFQVFHALPPMTSPKGLPVNAVFGFSRDMVYLRDEVKPTYLVCVFDKEGPTFRDAIDPEYKANRSPMPDDLRLQIPLICQTLEAMRIPVLAIGGVEADDVIATLGVKAAAKGMEVFLCTSDKDYRQLITDHVKMFNIRKQTVMGREELLADWGVTPEQVIDYQTLVGDSVDNVKGVPGIGPKTATQLLQQYGTIENLYQHIEEIKGKKRENLEGAKERLPQTRDLVRLKLDVEVAEEWDAWKRQSWDGPRLLEMFREFGFRGLSDLVRESLRGKDKSPPAAKPAAIVQGDLFGDESEAVAPPVIAPSTLQWEATYHLVNEPAKFDDFLGQLKQQRRFAIDLETTSLNPLEADIVGIAVCWRAGEAYYLALRGPKGESVLDPTATLDALRPILESPLPEKVNQNIKYDMQVLRNHKIKLDGIVGDPMVADYLLHAGQRGHSLDVLAEKHLGHRVIPISALIGKGKNQRRMDEIPCAKVAEYAGEDADVAWRLCEKLEPLLGTLGFKRSETGVDAFPLYDALEIPLIRVLADMEFEGIRLDVPLLQRLSKDMEIELGQLEQDIYRLAGREFNIGSVKQLREILFKELGFKPKGLTAITKEASTDQAALEELAKDGHELPKVLLRQRKIAKLKSTYVDALPALVQPKTGRVHASFNQTVAATGRLSSSEPNLQNIPIRSEEGEQIRGAFIAREGWELVAADYSQIELRLLAHFCADENLLRAFAEDRDIHGSVASQVFGVDEADVTSAQRRMAKTINFGIIYGISAFGLAARLEIDKDEAAKFIEAYFAKYAKVLEYQDNLLRECRERGFVCTILGRRRAIEGIRDKTTYKNRNQPEREAINMQIQGSAADLIKVAMLRIFERLQKEKREAKMLLQIHDELVFETPPGERDEIVELVRMEMNQALADRLIVPIKVDVSVGPNWLDMKDMP